MHCQRERGFLVLHNNRHKGTGKRKQNYPALVGTERQDRASSTHNMVQAGAGQQAV